MRLYDGTVLDGECDDEGRTLRGEEVNAKFRNNSSHLMTSQTVDDVIHSVMRLDERESLQGLLAPFATRA